MNINDGLYPNANPGAVRNGVKSFALNIMYNDDGTVDIKNTVDSNKNPKLGFVNTSRAVGTYSMQDMPGFNIFFKKTL